MNAFDTLTLQSSSTRRPALRSAITGAIFLLACAAGTGALAQAPQAEPAAQTLQTQAAAPSAGRTRAEVIAELECARASGELEASVLRTYGLLPTRQPSAAPCGQSGGTAIAGEAPRTTTH